ncbi:hypothetical protein EV356DRAFT_507477 [Viridothelium virens]|uniref:Cora-domain-containing protein n=1 Tax=Viridothelium virens TaxID=1048519 RepID=A0A6A6HKG6_VIRVR|nr:hypothetical protein EV356DRAFT_507477 [Viridothelium virens]
MIFLRGVPSPQWLNQLGASLDIDPEFFYRHIEVSPAFLPQSDSLHQSYLPPSPTTRNIFELRICNTGSWEPNHSRIALSELRRSSHDSMHQNLENFINWRHVSLGDSIVRRFSVHDLYCFTIEQKITVEVIFHTQQWAAIVWLDAGNDLGVSSVGPWLEGSASATHSIRLHPIYQHRDRIALSSYVHTQANNEGSQTDQNGTLKLPQTVNHLHNNYGRLLKSDVMEKDAFYALNELFHFSAASVDQYLALLEDKVGRITIDQPVSGLSELLMAKAIVDDYRRSVRETLHIVRCRGASNWPRVKEERWAQKAERSAKELESRYERLLQRCEDLSEQCGSGITLLADNRAKDQSQQAIEQTDKVAKLTFLAYIFVPLSFTASFFGMNFKELGQHLSLYTFFITSSTVLFISLVVMYCDLKKCFEKLWHALAHLWRLDIVRRSTTRQTDKLFEA